MYLCVSLWMCASPRPSLVYCLFTVTGLLLQDGLAQLKTDFGGVSLSRGTLHPLHSELEGALLISSGFGYR